MASVAGSSVPAPYAITGLKTGLDQRGNPPPRREVRDLYANYPEQFNLYLLGLRALQDIDFGERLSYFQIAGIHGVPWVDWDNVKGRIQPFYDPTKPASSRHPDFNGGYCVHDSILFPTWHRPYVMLLEQVLGNKILEIANRFRLDIKPKYVKAAETWRLPYWDYLAKPTVGKSTLPDFISGYNPEDGCFNHPNIEVLQPNGKIETIPNPLYSFEFDRFGFQRQPYMRIMAPLSPNKHTRRGWGLQSAATRSGENTVPSALTIPGQPEPSCNGDVARGYNKLLNENKQGDLRRLLLECKIYDAYASKGFGTYYAGMLDMRPDLFVTCPSVEKLHDLVHSGGGGNLGNIQEASFDPLFWLHHCNIDRWQAFWEALHPNTPWLPTQGDLDEYTIAHGETGLTLPKAKSSSSFTLAPGTVVNESTALKPFHKSTTRDDFWTSGDCRKLTKELGYSYPEFVDKDTFTDRSGLFDDLAFQGALKQRLNDLYTYDGKDYFDSNGCPYAAPTTSAGSTAPSSSAASATPKKVDMKEFPTDAGKALRAHPAMLLDAGVIKPSDKQLETSISALKKTPALPLILPENSGNRTYFITMGVQHYALEATFILFLFLGKIPTDIEEMFKANNRVSSMTVLANDPSFITGCANCVDVLTKGIMTWDATDITRSLVIAASDKTPPELPKLKSLAETDVIPYLTTNLNWCVVKVINDSHTFVPLTDPHLASMVITSRSEQVTPPSTGQVLPKVRDYKTHVEVTRGKPCGFSGTLPPKVSESVAQANKTASTTLAQDAGKVPQSSGATSTLSSEKGSAKTSK